jgi:hypothetical protein
MEKPQLVEYFVKDKDTLMYVGSIYYFADSQRYCHSTWYDRGTIEADEQTHATECGNISWTGSRCSSAIGFHC